MTVFTWDHSYATGIDSIDAQHQALFQSANDLHEACRTGNTGEAIASVLDHLVTYCNTHFEDEEAHMNRLGFPGLQTQQAEHRKLIAKVSSMLERYASGQPEVAMELSILLTQWLKQHIKEHDQVFADFVRSNGREAL